MAKLQKGDHVTWKTSRGETTGTVVKKLKKPTMVRGREVDASKQDPQLLVRSDKSGGKTAHKPSTLKKVKK